MTSPTPTTEIPTPITTEAPLPTGLPDLNTLGVPTGQPPTDTLPVGAQIPGAQIEPTTATATGPGDIGTIGDWSRWSAVALGGAYATKHGPQYTTALKDSLREKYNGKSWNGTSVVDKSTPTKWTTGGDASDRFRSVPEPANAGRTAESAASNAGRHRAETRSVIKEFSKVAGKKFATLPVARTVTKIAGKTAVKTAVSIGMRLGMRAAVFAIPGPGWAIGLAVFAATLLFDSDLRRMLNNGIASLFGVTNSPAIDAPPEWESDPSPTSTRFLPVTEDGDRDAVIRQKDADMVALNDAAFKFDPKWVWPPHTAEVVMTPDFAATTTKLQEIATRAADLHEQLVSTYLKYGSSEMYVRRGHEASKQAIDAFEAFHTTVLPGLGTTVAGSAEQINTLYQALREANLSARTEIADSGASLLPWTADVDGSSMGNVTNALPAFQSNISALHGALSQTVSGWNVPDPTQSKPVTTTPPKPSTRESKDSVDRGPTPSIPSSTTPSAPSTRTPSNTTPNNSKPDPADILRNIGTPVPQTPTQPAAPVNPLAANPLNNPALNPLGANPLGANPFSSLMNGLGNQPGLNQQQPRPAPVSDKSLENKIKSALEDRGVKPNTKAPDALKSPAPEKPSVATGPAPTDKPAADTKAVTTPKPGDPPPADPKPGDKPVEPEATPPAEQKRTVEIDGKEVNFDDPRLAKMVELLHPTDGSAPPTVQQAASEAGFTLPPPGQDIGQEVSTADLRPGDLIMGDKDRNGVFLGDGKVLADGQVRPIGDVARFTDVHQGVFRLDEGTPPTPPPAPPAADPAPATNPAPPQGPSLADGPAPAESNPHPAPALGMPEDTSAHGNPTMPLPGQAPASTNASGPLTSRIPTGD